MSTSLAVVLGFVLGVVAGALHLAVTWWRTSLALRRGRVLALATMPVGLLGVAALVLVAARLSPVCAWIMPLGIFAVRLVVVREAKR